MANIVQREQLDHQVVKILLPGLNQRHGVVPRIDMHEVCTEWCGDVVGDREPQHIPVEAQQIVYILDVQNTTCPMPSAPVRKPEIDRPGRNGSSAIAAP